MISAPSPARGARRPEVLAPAGDRESMRAAVRAGADAVYFGLQGFNARARATNFDEKELGATLAFLHDHGVKGYVTLNTLVFDAELAGVEAAIRACASAGVDAVIVQDLGVAALVRAIAPGLPVHASTQMTCTDAAAVELAASLGASRVILARELSLDDIRRIKTTTDVELEVFVHGALCIAYSGQCLTSEAIGGRSANRGACAQACRLPYELVVDGVLQDLGDRAYLLSPEDLEASSAIAGLVDLGIASVKIEGRLKGPEYVAATTLLYRRAIDAALGVSAGPDETTRFDALQMFSRGSGPGFLEGVDHQRLVEGRACDHRGVLAGACEGVTMVRGKRYLAIRTSTPLARGDGILVEGGYASEGELGGRVWTIAVGGKDVERTEAGTAALVWLGPEHPIGDGAHAGRRVWKTNDPSREKAVLASIERDPWRTPVDFRLSGKLGEHPVLEATTSRGTRAQVVVDAPLEKAEKAPLTHLAIEEKLAKLGETPFALGTLALDLPEACMFPISALNRARRAVVEALLRASARTHATTDASHADLLAHAVVPDRAPPPGGLFVLCRTLEQAVAAAEAGADGVYLDFLELTGTGAALRALRALPPREGHAPLHITLAPPRIRKPGEEKIDKFLLDLKPDALLVRGLGALHETSSDPASAAIPRIGDFSLNVTNKITAAEVLRRGLVAFTPSFDLDAAQLATLLASPFAPFAEVVVHHPMPLFHMEHCVIAALLSEGKDYKTCGRPCDTKRVSLRDRAGMDHPVEADVGCRNTVFHAASQSAAGVVEALRASGVARYRIELVRETKDEVTRIVTAYRALLEGRTTASALWRSLNTEGGYGVVRGSLRILAT
jgi:putative protease